MKSHEEPVSSSASTSATQHAHLRPSAGCDSANKSVEPSENSVSRKRRLSSGKVADVREDQQSIQGVCSIAVPVLYNTGIMPELQVI